MRATLAFNGLTNERCKYNCNFSKIKEVDLKKELLTSTSAKATLLGKVPAKISKDGVDIFVGDFFVLINYCLVKGIFSGEPEIGTVSLIFKKFESLEGNYWRLVCCLRVTFTFTIR